MKKLRPEMIHDVASLKKLGGALRDAIKSVERDAYDEAAQDLAPVVIILQQMINRFIDKSKEE